MAHWYAVTLGAVRAPNVVALNSVRHRRISHVQKLCRLQRSLRQGSPDRYRLEHVLLLQTYHHVHQKSCSDQIGQIGQIDQIDQIDQVDQIDQIDQVDQIYRSDQFDVIDKIDPIDQINK